MRLMHFVPVKKYLRSVGKRFAELHGNGAQHQSQEGTSYALPPSPFIVPIDSQGLQHSPDRTKALLDWPAQSLPDPIKPAKTLLDSPKQ
jgi:hypothetical protein